MSQEVTISFRASREFREELEKVAGRSGVSMSTYIKQQVEQAMKRDNGGEIRGPSKASWDAFQRFAGCVSSEGKLHVRSDIEKLPLGE